MMSANPHSGIHEAQVAKTLDTTVPTITTEIAHQTGAHMGFSGGVFAGA